MPLYFAYGANMDPNAMRQRAPNSRVLGRARLVRHKFFIMKSGFASVRRDPHADVHGVLFHPLPRAKQLRINAGYLRGIENNARSAWPSLILHGRPAPIHLPYFLF